MKAGSKVNCVLKSFDQNENCSITTTVARGYGHERFGINDQSCALVIDKKEDVIDNEFYIYDEPGCNGNSYYGTLDHTHSVSDRGPSTNYKTSWRDFANYNLLLPHGF